jgi:hypothetical protein
MRRNCTAQSNSYEFGLVCTPKFTRELTPDSSGRRRTDSIAFRHRPPDMLTWNKARIFWTNAAVETSAAQSPPLRRRDAGGNIGPIIDHEGRQRLAFDVLICL